MSDSQSCDLSTTPLSFPDKQDSYSKGRVRKGSSSLMLHQVPGSQLKARKSTKVLKFFLEPTRQQAGPSNDSPSLVFIGSGFKWHKPAETDILQDKKTECTELGWFFSNKGRLTGIPDFSNSVSDGYYWVSSQTPCDLGKLLTISMFGILNLEIRDTIVPYRVIMKMKWVTIHKA